MTKPSEETVAVYSTVRDYSGLATRYEVALADALRDAEARCMGAEFELSNHCITCERQGDGVQAYRVNFDDNDPRHGWTEERWQQEADKKLRGES